MGQITTLGSGASESGTKTASGGGHRHDIEGLRAVAVCLVMVYHAGAWLLPGGFIGVDVFFVISGYLITGLLLKEARSSGTISLRDFYARRAKRLLPAATLVLVTVSILTLAFLPKLRWATTGWDIFASCFYVLNWRLANSAVDYLAQDNAPSSLQHFWSLGVEEQFYLVWPLLIIALLLSRGSNSLSTGRLVAGLLALGVPSFLWSLHLTYQEPGRAYFVSTTRVWELAIGALLAIAAHKLNRIPTLIGSALSWVGLSCVVSSALLIDASVPFPGWVALLPTVGTAAVIAGGPSAANFGPAVLLGLPPMRWIGALSYSLYLWHWPLLVVAESVVGRSSTALSVAVVLGSSVPAYLTYRFVENPIRSSERLRLRPTEYLRYGGLATTVTAVAGLLVALAAWPPPAPLSHVQIITARQNDGDAAGSSEPSQRIGALLLSAKARGDKNGAPVDRVDSFTPTALEARADVPAVYELGCHVEQAEVEARYCSFGDESSDFRVALIGDSHAAQWVSPMSEIATAEGWRLRTYTKSACPLTDVTVMAGQQPYEACSRWNQNVLSDLRKDPPQLVVTSSSQYLVSGVSASQSEDELVEGYKRSWKSLTDLGSKVAVIMDTPHPASDIAECVARHDQELKRCSFAREKAVTGAGLRERAASGNENVHEVDLNDAICPTDMCAVVIGEVLVYRDTNHLTDTYARTLGPRLQRSLTSMIKH